MPQPTPEQRSEAYAALNLYEAVLRMRFAYVNRITAITEIDNLYVHLGLRDALKQQLASIAPYLKSKPSKKLLPETIAGMTNKQDWNLQTYFGEIKTYAKNIKAHSATIDPRVQSIIDDAEVVLNGGRVKREILLAESEVGNYSYETKSLTINQTPITFGGNQEDYFLWVMFKQRLGVSISWDVLYDEINDEFGDTQVFRGGLESMRQAKHRVNRTIKTEAGTKDDLFTYKLRGFKRNFGPEIT